MDILDTLETIFNFSSEEDLLAHLAEFLGMLPSDVVSEISEKMVRKDLRNRFNRYLEIQNELLSTGKPLVSGATYEEEYIQFLQLVAHAEGLWEDSCRLFEAGSYPTSLFLSIVCMEEVAKVGVARFQLLSNELRRRKKLSATYLAPSPSRKSRKKHPFYSHTQKHILAAGAGALVNSRLDRILGLDNVIRFLDEVEQGKLETLRQNCVYADHDGQELILPKNKIGKEEALFYVTLAGELLIEVAGWEPGEFKRLLAKVEKFEVANGVVPA